MLVQWRSSFDGNSPILHYQLQYRKSGDKDWCVFADEIKEKIAIVEELEEDSSYRYETFVFHQKYDIKNVLVNHMNWKQCLS